MRLMSIAERLNNPEISNVERLQREIFLECINRLPRNPRKVLSLSCGDGVWDYLVMKQLGVGTEIVATDIVACPVKSQDQELLRSCGVWSYVQIIPDEPFPFPESSFDLIIHQDVIEHVSRPNYFLREQNRVLRKNGAVIFGTPNLHRPANILKLLSGRLSFPAKIGHSEEIGDYIHVQEFYDQQIKLMLAESGFTDIQVHPSYFGLHFLFSGLMFSDRPQSRLGRGLAHFLTCSAIKV